MKSRPLPSSDRVSWPLALTVALGIALGGAFGIYAESLHPEITAHCYEAQGCVFGRE